MQTAKNLFIVLVILCGLLSKATAQVSSLNNSSLQGGSSHTAMPMADSFTGFKVQLFTTKEALTTNDLVFERFDQVFFEQTLDHGFVYLVGSFSAENDASVFLKEIQPKYPAARVVAYQSGKRAGMADTETVPTRCLDIF